MQTLKERIEAAIDRVTNGHAPMRVPVDQTDVDIVLADCAERIATLEAENARLREIIRKCARIPVMPFPDPEAHSWRSFGEAAYSAYSRIRVLLSEAETK